MSDATVLVLGCGIGGVVAAREARRLLPKSNRVIVVDKEQMASFPPSYPWVMLGEKRGSSLARRRADLVRHDIEFVSAEVRQIDLDARFVRADQRELRYDYLVIALGAETPLDTHPGLAEAQTFYTQDGAERLGAQLRYFSGGRIAIAVAGQPFKGPGAPYEAAMLLEHFFHKRALRSDVEIDLYTPEPRPLASAGRETSETVRGLLAHKGIGYHLGKQLASVDPSSHEVRFSDGEVAEFQLLIAVPEHRAPQSVVDTGLANTNGWVSVDRKSLETARANVFAVGDLTHIPLIDGGELPKLGVLAEHQALTAARNIAYRLNAGPEPDPFDAKVRAFVEVGGGAALMYEGDYLARNPRFHVSQPSIVWHLAKRALEKYWLWRWY